MITIFLIVLISFYYEKKTKIGAMPSWSSVGKIALKLIPDNFSKDGQYQILDLGSGWGGVLATLSKLFPNSKITGYELSPWPFLYSSVRLFSKRKKIQIMRKDFFDNDISSADIIFCYLSPYHMDKLKEKFATLPDGKCIISCAFPILGWKIDKEDFVHNFFVKTPVFRYITGAA